MSEVKGRESQVYVQLERMRELISESTSIIGVLEKRLSPLLRPAIPKEDVMAEKENLVELAAEISDLSNLIERDTREMKNISDRLEI